MDAFAYKLTKAVNSLSATQAELIGLALLVLGAVVDFSTSDVYSPLFFYIPSMMFVAWASPRARGWLFVVLIALSTVLVHYAHGFDYATNYADLYNGGSLVAMSALVYWTMRTLRISMRELQEAKARLETLNHEKNILFGIISHDLRSPLAVMLTFSRLIIRSAGSMPAETLQKLAKEHEDTVQKLLGLLENLLEWARVQMGDLALAPRPVEVEEAILRGIEPVAASAEQKGVAVREQIAPNLRLVGDERALASVVRNLVSNAIKFTPAGGCVDIAACGDASDVLITVKDNGIGMSPKMVDDLFSAKEAISSRGTAGEKGAGLGLILSKEIVERLGGRICVSSEIAKGTQVEVRIPRSLGKQADRRQAA